MSVPVRWFQSSLLLTARLPAGHRSRCRPSLTRRSRRADPLAAWTNSLDLSAVVADTDRAFLILETGFNQRWRFVFPCLLRTLRTVLAFACCLPPAAGLHPSAGRGSPCCAALPPPPCPCSYGAYRRSVESTAEAQAWEETKKAVG